MALPINLEPTGLVSRFITAAIQNFVNTCNVVVCCYVGDNKLKVNGKKALIGA
jgi:hypothetical protein